MYQPFEKVKTTMCLRIFQRSVKCWGKMKHGTSHMYQDVGLGTTWPPSSSLQSLTSALCAVGKERQAADLGVKYNACNNGVMYKACSL